MKRIFACFAALACFSVSAHADETQVAVAANFTAPMKQIAEAFVIISYNFVFVVIAS